MKRALLILAFLISACSSPVHETKKTAEAPQQPPPQHAFRFITYTPETRTLGIQFNDGSRSNFTGVSQDTYIELLKAPAKLAYFTNSIQGRYPSQPGD